MSEQSTTRRLFLIGVVLKGAHALIELVGGLALVLVTTPQIQGMVHALTFGELAEDPHDFIANQLRDMAAGISVGSQHFFALYLLAHGAIKVVLVGGLLADKRWAFPAALTVLSGFVVYQLYRYSHTHSLALLVLTLFDVVVLVLIWREWRQEIASRAAKASAAAARPH